MMKHVLAAAALCAGAAIAAPASAMPLDNLGTVAGGNVENVRLVCDNRGYCWETRRGRYRSYGYAQPYGYGFAPGYSYGPSVSFSFGPSWGHRRYGW
jgi:hypothetical protein